MKLLSLLFQYGTGKEKREGTKSLFVSGKTILRSEVRWILRSSDCGMWEREKGFEESSAIAVARRVIALQNCFRNFFIDRDSKVFRYCTLGARVNFLCPSTRRFAEFKKLGKIFWEKESTVVLFLPNFLPNGNNVRRRPRACFCIVSLFKTTVEVN